eukprot:631498-Pleurochrysis_carterae.AAC.1
MPLRRRQLGGAMGADPLCAYDALRAIWADREPAVPVHERTFGKPSTTPLFVTADGGAWTSTESRALARLMAA